MKKWLKKLIQQAVTCDHQYVSSLKTFNCDHYTCGVRCWRDEEFRKKQEEAVISYKYCHKCKKELPSYFSTETSLFNRNKHKNSLWQFYFSKINRPIRRFKHAYIHNPFGYPTFWDYWKGGSHGQNILTEARKWDGKKGFLKVWFKVYKYRS